ncbi:MAG: molybdenum cofactor biosynthesis protein MoeB [Chloroflexi bacterium HGW-Chloroflexi-10]|nr:MAG: molybdenum cofactor biosynthesis protein MoeB [Chloroflexi bacterium HGW-Chloroflexi-10]
MTTLNQEEILRYSRHLMIPEVGLSGQAKLKQSSVLIVGTGGLGSPISLYLAAAGVGRLGLVDDDLVDSSNLQRQIVHGSSTVGMPKVISAKQRLSDLNPYINIEVFHERFDSLSAERIGNGYDLIVDGTDNFSTRYLINDYCVLRKKPYIFGSIFRFEGQVSIFASNEGPCYRCIFPEPPPAELAPTCGEGGVFGVLPGIIGAMQAAEVIKILLGLGSPLIGKLLLYDALDQSMQSIKIKKNPNCKVCGDNPQIQSLEETQIFCALHEATEQPIPIEWAVTPHYLEEMIKNNQKIRIVDVRETVESEIARIPGSESIPFERLLSLFENQDTSQKVVFICRTGIRSMRAVRLLRQAGQSNVFNLSGGTNAWARDVDPTQFIY